MKKILYIFTIFLLISGCKKSAFVAEFDQLPEERMSESIALVRNTLTSAPNGWTATLSTAAGGGFGFYMTFDDQQAVNMYADLTDEASTTSVTSTYRVKTGLGANLIFDTYNYISMLADPGSAIFGGTQPTGFKSDVEFTYVRSSADSIVFIGKQYRQLLKMARATAAQKASYTSGAYKTAINKLKNFFTTVKYPYIDVASGANTLKVGFNLNTTSVLASGKRATLTAILEDGTSTATATGKFAFTLNGAEFIGPDFVYQGIIFVRLAWKDSNTLALYDTTGKEYILKSSPVPLTPLTLLFGYPSSFTYRKITIPGTGLPGGVTSGFNSVYATVISNFAAGNRSINFVTVTLTSNSSLQVFVSYTSGASVFTGTADFTYTRNGDVITLGATPVTSANWTTRAVQLLPLTNYMTSGPFKIDWVVSTAVTTEVLGGLYRTADPSSFLYGTL